MTDITYILAFLQAILIALAGIGVVKVWNLSILLASINTKLETVCDTIEDHENRIRDLEAA